MEVPRPMMRFKWIVAVVSLVAASAAIANSAAREIYPDPVQGRIDVAAALKTAAKTHKRALLDFGGNWCGDCQVLDIYFHNETNRPILDANFVLVHVNVGYMDQNVDLAAQYGVVPAKGVPALAVLSDAGKALFSQQSGKFKAMGQIEPSVVTNFLIRWKPTKPGCSAVMLTC